MMELASDIDRPSLEPRQSPPQVSLPQSTRFEFNSSFPTSPVLRALEDEVLSVCIPAYNEEETLAAAVQSVQQSELWKLASKKELLICLNACSDSTPLIAKQLAAEDSNIKVINIQTKGKNNAWMELSRRSSPGASILYFLDADSLLRTDTLYRLFETLLKRTDLSAASSEIYPLPEASKNDSWFQKMVRIRLSERLGGVGARDEINGNCYALRRSVALGVTMPSDQRICEDAFLNLKLRGKIKRVDNTACYQGVPNMRDFMQQVSRTRLSTQQLKRQHSELFVARTKDKEESIKKYGKHSLAGILARAIIEGVRFAGRIKSIWVSFQKKDSWRKVSSSKLSLKGSDNQDM